MGLKTNLFLNNLKLHLGIQNLDDINEKHTKEIMDFLKIHEDKEVLRELIKRIPNFLSFAKESIKCMSSVVTTIINAGNKEVEGLKEIIVQLTKAIDNDNLNEDEKDKVFNLIDNFSALLEKQLDRNYELKKIIVTNAFGVITFSIAISAFIVYKSVGGKNGEELLTQAGSKMIQQA